MDGLSENKIFTIYFTQMLHYSNTFAYIMVTGDLKRFLITGTCFILRKVEFSIFHLLLENLKKTSHLLIQFAGTKIFSGDAF